MSSIRITTIEITAENTAELLDDLRVIALEHPSWSDIEIVRLPAASTRMYDVVVTHYEPRELIA